MQKSASIRLVTFSVLVIAVIGCSAPGGEVKSSEMQESEQVVARQFEKWKSGEAGFFDLLADDVHWVVSGRSPGGSQKAQPS